VPEAERAAAKWEYLNGNPIGIDVKRDGPLTPAVAHDGGIWRVGMGGVFYFRPGHETYPVFQQAETLRVIENSVRWLASFE
jgi:hypothetical protein